MKFDEWNGLSRSARCARSIATSAVPIQDSASALEHSAKNSSCSARARDRVGWATSVEPLANDPEALARVLDQSQLLHLLADLVHIPGKGSWRSMENAGGCALVNWQVHLALFYVLRESHRSIDVAD